MKRPKRAVRRLVIGAISYIFFILGIILVPFPGPGLLMTFFACWMLAKDFDWAKKRLIEAWQRLVRIYEESRTRANRIEALGERNRP